MTSPSDPRDTQALDDERAINELLLRYTAGIDTKDWTLFRSAFVSNCEATYGGEAVHGLDALATQVQANHEHLHASLHRVTNVQIAFDGGDRASCSSYSDALLVRRDHPQGSVFHVVGTYDDDLVRTDDGWRFSRRTYRYVWADGNRGVVGWRPGDRA